MIYELHKKLLVVVMFGDLPTVISSILLTVVTQEKICN
jgi:hypothetical protein